MMKPIQPMDLNSYWFLSKLTMNPYREEVIACVRSQMELQENRYCHELMIKKGKVWETRLKLKKPGLVCFLDADTLLLTNAETSLFQSDPKKTQFLTYSLKTGDLTEILSLPFPVSSAHYLGGTQLIVKAEVDENVGEDEANFPTGNTYKENVMVLEELPWCANGRGFISRHRNRLFVADWTTQQYQPITSSDFQCGGVTACPDHHQVLFTGMTYKYKASQKEGLFCYDAVKQEVTTLIEEGVFRRIKEPCFLKDSLVFAATKGERYGKNEALDFYLLNPKTKQYRLLKSLDHPLGSSVVSDCRLNSGSAVKVVQDQLYFTMTVGWTTPLFRLDCDGKLERILDFDGSIDDFAFNNQTLWLIAQRANALQALVTVDLKTKKLKTEIDWNQAALLDRYVAQPRYFPFSSRGRRIDGWVMPPINYDSSQQYPAVLQIHGGPNLAYGEVFHHEMQMLASAGYFVLFCNPVGSVGRTDEFADIRGRCGDEDYQNLMDFISAVLPAFPAIDSKRVAVCGGSYGGFMVNWIIGHTSQFVCAVSQRSIANFMTIYGLSDFGYYFVRDQLAAEPLSEAGQAAIHQQSPIRYVGNVQTPTLFLHSDQDWRCPLSEGLQMFTALTDLGVKTRMVCFQGENHELSRSGKPQARQRRLFEIQSWLDQWCHKQ